ncbi:MAG: alpha/beta fold hydrolase [Planctomycetes bacterium]|nr:alpha/beta fold hydrolase [Planctomycetota bacterium]
MLWLLHGFLGRAADWDEPARALAAGGFGTAQRPDLFAPEPGGGEPWPELRPTWAGPDLPSWGARFAARAAARGDGRPAVLIGYSLGGRLALHALLAAPAVWRAAILVSTHPGLESAAERAARRGADESWARRFEAEPWEGLMAAWQAQPVFGGRGRVLRRTEADFDRTALAAALGVWSLGTQENLLPRLRTLNLPVLWLAGDGDETFARLAREGAAALPRGECRLVEGAAHRVPWEAPAALLACCRTFLNRLEE